MKILTTGRLGEEFCKALRKTGMDFDITYAEIPTQVDIERADCLAAFSVSKDINLSGLRWIHSFGAGVDVYHQREDLSRDTIITRTVGNLGFRMGEFCLNHILSYYQNTFQIFKNSSIKKWESIPPRSIAGESVLILGTGEMARGISRVLHPLQMNIIGVNTKGTSPDSSFQRCITFDEIKNTADRISCIINTLPLTKKTDGLLDKTFFGRFSNALFINLGRGKSVVTDDLLASISNGDIAYTVFDVFAEEPLPVGSPLWDHPKIFISPHQSAVTDLQDILDSFLEAHRLLQSNNKNNLFVDFDKGY